MEECKNTSRGNACFERNPGENNVESSAKPLERFSKKELIALVRQLIGEEQ